MSRHTGISITMSTSVSMGLSIRMTMGTSKGVCIVLVCKCEPVPACHPQYGEKMLKK